MTDASFPWTAHYPTGLTFEAELPVRPIYDMLAATCETYGDRPAFDFLGGRQSWADIGQMCDRLAVGLQSLGIKKGDRVGILLPNCPLFVAAYYAIARIGGVIVNFNPLYAERELQHQLVDSGAVIMITANLKLTQDKLMKVRRASPVLRHILVADFASMLPFPKNILVKVIQGGIFAHSRSDDLCIPLEKVMKTKGKVHAVVIDPVHDVALLQYTGGTTGTPKGAMLTHANITANTHQCGLWFSDCQNGYEKMLGVIPFFHVFAMTAVMNLSVLKGLEIIALPRFDLNDTIKIIHRKKPTLFPAVPAIFNAINHHPDLKKYDLRSLRHCISGGAPLPAEVKRTFESHTGCVLVEGYGLTETSPVTHVNPLGGLNKTGSIGLPLPGTFTDIIDPKTGALMPIGEKGEICIRGPQVMKGYWNKPDETAAVLKDGRLHTGDVGYMDADGYTFIVDRMKDMIITNGYNVYPRNVEEAIYIHPDVRECVVAGVPDADRGERVKAWIVLKNGIEMAPDVMRSFLRDKLSPMEIPREIEFRTEALPKTLIGKLSRKALVEAEKNRST